MLPREYPKWSTVYYYFKVWKHSEGSDLSTFDKALAMLVAIERIRNNKEANTTFCIVNVQSVKNVDTAENKSYDAGKNVSGKKRHIAVDTLGLPHALCVTTAEVTDRKGALQKFTNCKDHLISVVNVLVDGGYRGKNFADSVKASVEVIKRNELHKFKVLPKRWIVERSGWTSVEGYGKTVREKSKQVYKWSSWLLLQSY